MPIPHSIRTPLATLLLGALVAGCDGSGPASTTDAPDRTAEAGHTDVRALVDDQAARYLATDPELATYYGLDPDQAGGAHAGRLGDYSPEAAAARRALLDRFVAELDAIDRASLSDADRVTVDVARSTYATATGAADIAYGRIYPFWYVGHTPYVVNQISGPAIEIPNQMAAQQQVTTAEEARDYIARLADFGRAFDTIIAKVKADAAVGAAPPRVLIERTLAVLDGFTATAPADNSLYTTFVRKLEAAGLAEDARQTLQADALAAVETVVYPAYTRLRQTMAGLQDGARAEAGIWAVPDGAAFYQAAIATLGGSDLDAEAIHAIGLREVDRISAEMDAILRAQGMAEGTVGQRMVALGEDPRFLYADSDEGRARLLDDLNAQVAEISALMPEYFATIPPQPVEIRRVPVFSEASAPGGYYDSPSLDGTRPGIYWINLRDMTAWPSWSLKTLTYHEAVPGHHFQTAVALDAGDLPLVRRIGSLNAYNEGWALYSERLAWEMGLYDGDPFGDLGRLQDELFRAVRLVVDTGLHHKRWTREQAIDYMFATTGSAMSDVVSEIERYMAWPGQALGYKLGQIKILELRDKARTALADDFDLKAFHDVLLLDGAVPMNVLEAKVDAWIASAGQS